MTASQRGGWFPASPFRFLNLIQKLTLNTSYTEIRCQLLGLYIVIDSVVVNRRMKRAWNERMWPSLTNCPWLFPEELRKTTKHLKISGISEEKWTGRQLNTSQNHRSLRQRTWYSSIILNTILNIFLYNDRRSNAEICLFSYLLLDLMTLLDCTTTGPRLGKIWNANLDASEDISISVGTLRIIRKAKKQRLILKSHLLNKSSSPSSSEVKNYRCLYMHSPYITSWCVRGQLQPYILSPKYNLQFCNWITPLDMLIATWLQRYDQT